MNQLQDITFSGIADIFHKEIVETYGNIVVKIMNITNYGGRKRMYYLDKNNYIQLFVGNEHNQYISVMYNDSINIGCFNKYDSSQMMSLIHKIGLTNYPQNLIQNKEINSLKIRLGDIESRLGDIENKMDKLIKMIEFHPDNIEAVDEIKKHFIGEMSKQNTTS